jgi:hypothetical protein
MRTFLSKSHSTFFTTISFLLFSFLLISSCNEKKEQNDFKKYEVRNIDIKIDDEVKNALNYLSLNMNPLVESETYNDGNFSYTIHAYFYFDITQKSKNLIVKRTWYIKKESQISNGQAIDNNRHSDTYYIIPIEKMIPNNINIDQPHIKSTDDILNNSQGRIGNVLEIELLYNQQGVDEISVFYQDDGYKIYSIHKFSTDDVVLSFNDDYDKCLNFIRAFRSICKLNREN